MLPRLLPLEYAAQRTGLDIETLREMVAQGKVVAGISPEGGILVAVRDGKVVMLENGQANGNGEGGGGDVFELNRRLAQIQREQFAHLEGSAIRLSTASRKYDVPIQTLRDWIKRGYVNVVERRPKRVLVNEADVAFCSALYHVRKPYGSRAPLLDKGGNPYLLKRPELAQLRRERALGPQTK